MASISYIGTLSKVQFILDFGLFKAMVYVHAYNC